jgi:hypothetical protein
LAPASFSAKIDENRRTHATATVRAGPAQRPSTPFGLNSETFRYPPHTSVIFGGYTV